MSEEVNSKDISGEDFAALFQSLAKDKSGQRPCLKFSPLAPSQIPSKFASLVEEWFDSWESLSSLS